jgi:hypothetical protein
MLAMAYFPSERSMKMFRDNVQGNPKTRHPAQLLFDDPSKLESLGGDDSEGYRTSD